MVASIGQVGLMPAQSVEVVNKTLQGGENYGFGISDYNGLSQH